MGSWMLWGLIGVFLAGIALAIYGIRGRRINRDPVCRDCGFNLGSMRLPEMHGITAPGLGDDGGEVPVVVTCPECGGGLKRAKAVRIGERRRMPVVATSGIVLSATAVVPVVALLLGALQGKTVLAHLPTGVLCRMASGDSTAIAEELEARITSKGIGTKQAEPVVERILELQADWERPWSEAWGSTFDAAIAAGFVSPSQGIRWKENAVTFRAKARSEMNPGDPLVLRIQRMGVRLGAASVAEHDVGVESIQIDGRAVTGQVKAGSKSRHNAHFYTAAGRGDARISRDLAVGIPELPAGKHPFRVVLAVQPAGSSNPLPGAKSRRFSLIGELIVRGPDQPTIRTSVVDAAARAGVRSYLKLSEVCFSLSGWSTDSAGNITPNSWRMTHEFPWDQQPTVPLAMRVLLTDAKGNEWSAGTITTNSFEEDGSGIVGTQIILDLSISANLELEGPVSIIFRPDIRLAKESFGVQEYFAEEVRFDALPLWWSIEFNCKPRFERAEDAILAKQKTKR